MKMKCFIVVFLGVLSQACSEKPIKSEWTEEKLYGEVKSYSEYYYRGYERFGKIEKGMPKRELSNYGIYMEFDEKGNCINWGYYGADGNIESKVTFNYDKKGNLIEKAEYGEEGNLLWKVSFKYDESGNMIQYTNYRWYNGDPIIERCVNESDGNMDKVYTCYDLKGELESKKSYKFDERGNLIEEAKYDSGGDLDIKKSYKYDERGNLIEEAEYSRSLLGNSLYLSTNKYDNDGNVIEEKDYGSDGEVIWDAAYEYNKKGHCVEERRYGLGGSLKFIWTFDYEYDVHGNWIRRIRFEDGKPSLITEREYKYYD